jgi:hypothetical protein
MIGSSTMPRGGRSSANRFLDVERTRPLAEIVGLAVEALAKTGLLVQALLV